MASTLSNSHANYEHACINFAGKMSCLDQAQRCRRSGSQHESPQKERPTNRVGAVPSRARGARPPPHYAGADTS